MNWILFGMIAIIIGLLVWQWIRNNKKEDKPQTVFLFKYYIGKEEGKPIEFLSNWKINILDSYVYLLYLRLDDDLYFEGYLHKVWVNYSGCVHIEVFEKENGVHKPVGRYDIEEGKMYWSPA